METNLTPAEKRKITIEEKKRIEEEKKAKGEVECAHCQKVFNLHPNLLHLYGSNRLFFCSRKCIIDELVQYSSYSTKGKDCGEWRLTYGNRGREIVYDPVDGEETTLETIAKLLSDADVSPKGTNDTSERVATLHCKFGRIKCYNPKHYEWDTAEKNTFFTLSPDAAKQFRREFIHKANKIITDQLMANVLNDQEPIDWPLIFKLKEKIQALEQLIDPEYW